MVNELLSTMNRTKAAQGFDVKLIKLTRRHYDELRREMAGHPMYCGALVDGEVERLNGAAIEVV